MEITSKYTKVFVSDDLTRTKYGELYDLAVSIREQKNTISKEYVKYSDNLENNKRKYLPVCHTTDDLLQFDSGFKPEYVDWNTFDEFEYPNREGYVRAKDVDARIDDLMKNKKC